jgi:hypothetical protein
MHGGHLSSVVRAGPKSVRSSRFVVMNARTAVAPYIETRMRPRTSWPALSRPGSGRRGSTWAVTPCVLREAVAFRWRSDHPLPAASRFPVLFHGRPDDRPAERQDAPFPITIFRQAQRIGPIAPPDQPIHPVVPPGRAGHVQPAISPPSFRVPPAAARVASAPGPPGPPAAPRSPAACAAPAPSDRPTSSRRTTRTHR